MTIKNDQIARYLEEYYSMLTPPRFAVLVKGKWGSGKTWFIKKSIENLKNQEKKALYVSLYGISTTKQIDEEIFRQLHPVLGGKGMALLGAVAKGVLRGAIKIDLDGDGKSDGTLSPQIPDIKLPDFLKNSAENILFFDDIERCGVKITELLGYINYFVEHGDHKVVLVANEDEIIKSNREISATDTAAYERVREKLIGKAFSIESDVSHSFSDFLGELKTDHRELIAPHKMVLESLYKASGHENLRNFRQALLEASRILSVLAERHLEKKDLIQDVLVKFFALTFEIRSGTIAHACLSDLGENVRLAYFLSDSPQASEEQKELIKTDAKYTGFGWLNDVVSDAVMAEILTTGLIDSEKLNSSLDASKHYSFGGSPLCLKLWHFNSMSDAKFNELLPQLVTQLESGVFLHIGEVLQAASVAFRLNELGLYPHRRASILKQAKDQVKKYAKTANGSIDFDSASVSAMDSWGGFRFFNCDKPEFQGFRDFAAKEMHQTWRRAMMRAANELLGQLKVDAPAFARSMHVTRDGDNKYASIPILAHMDPEIFANTLIELPQTSDVYSAFRQRYRLAPNDSLIVEKGFLLRASRLLLTEAGKRKKQVSGNQLKELGELLKHCAEQFNSNS